MLPVGKEGSETRLLSLPEQPQHARAREGLTPATERHTASAAPTVSPFSLLFSHLLVILGGDLALSRAKASRLTSSLDSCPRNASSLHACPSHVRNLGE